jgi:cytochrome c oxidase subunit 2
MVLTIGVAGFAFAQDAGSGLEVVGRSTWWLPENVFPATEPIDRLFYAILYLTCGIGLAVFAVMVVFLFKYRYRSGRRASYLHGNSRLEVVWTLIPTAILIIIAASSQKTWSKIKHQPSESEATDPIHIEVVGRQFQWFFRYAGKDGKFGPRRPELVDFTSSNSDEMIGLDRSDPDGRDDILSPKMYIPVNRRVYIDLTSVDVLHSFFLPNFRLKLDAVPGINGRLWIESIKTNTEVNGVEADGTPKPFDIVCAELCGQGHFKMRGQLFAVSDQEYDRFIEEETSYLDLGTDESDSY